MDAENQIQLREVWLVQHAWDVSFTSKAAILKIPRGSLPWKQRKPRFFFLIENIPQVSTAHCSPLPSRGLCSILHPSSSLFLFESFLLFSVEICMVYSLLNPCCLFKKTAPTFIYKPMVILFCAHEIRSLECIYFSPVLCLVPWSKLLSPFSWITTPPPLNSSKNHCGFLPLSSWKSLLPPTSPHSFPPSLLSFLVNQ